MNISQAEIVLLLSRALESHNVSPANAQSVAQALAQAQCDGQVGHGVSRIVSYCKQSKSGKVDGFATPKVLFQTPAALRIDAMHGFAFPAIDLAINELANKASVTGISCATVTRSHHFGVAGWHAERLANKGLIGIVVGNSPAAIAPHGGNLPLFGTNPIAFAAPRQDNFPFVIDLSLSKVARGKVMVAAKEGRSIPEGWGLDAMGHATTDPHAVLEGSMLPMGEAKGSALVLMVEILAAALSGSNFGYEASSFFDEAGEPPGVGQTLICLEPKMLSGNMFGQRLENLIHAILDQPETRLPGSRRLELRSIAEREGVNISPVLYEELLGILAD